MDSNVFNIRTEVFTGPLELLLALIEKRKLLINDVSLAKVTDDFIQHVKASGKLLVPQTAHFVYIASTLLLIKSKSLLPIFSLTEDEEGSIEDLELRLKFYKYFRKIAQNIDQMFGKRIIFFKSPEKISDPIFSPQTNLTPDLLLQSILDIVQNLPRKKIVKEVTIQKMMTIEEVVQNLTARIQNSISLSFREFSGADKSAKIDIIVSFLAMLELVKQEIISVRQEVHFDDIQMENRNIGVPHYGE